MLTIDQVYDRIATVMDPELHIDIVALGLIYGVIVTETAIEVTMTLTTPGCPLAPEIDRLLREALKPLGDYEVKVKLVWEPAWTSERMTDEAKLTLGMI